MQRILSGRGSVIDRLALTCFEDVFFKDSIDLIAVSISLLALVNAGSSFKLDRYSAMMVRFLSSI